MDVSIENQGAIGRKLTITVPADTFQKNVSKRLSHYRKTAKIAGFRKGKIPSKIIEQQYGGQARMDAVDAVINETYPQALRSQEIIPAGLLKITPTQFPSNDDKGEDFVYEAEIEVFPEVPAPNLKGVEIDQPKVSVEEADIDRTIESIQKKQTEFTPVERAAKDGDRVTMNFLGTIDGVPFEGGKGEDIPLVIGDGQFLADFEKAVKGAKTGEEKTAKVKFPDDYQGQDVAGKTAEFAITVTEVAEGKLPELNDDFAAQMGVEGGIATLRDEVRDGLQRELDNKLRGHVRDQVMDALAKNTEFELPKALVEEEIDRAAKEMTAQFEAQGMSAKGMVQREHYREASEQRVKLGLIMREIVDSHKLEANDEMLRARATEMAASYAEPEKFVEHIMKDPQQRNQIMGALLEEMMVEKMLESAKIKSKKMPYQNFMGGDMVAP